jgi:hypothetical protein
MRIIATRYNIRFLNSASGVSTIAIPNVSGQAKTCEKPGTRKGRAAVMKTPHGSLAPIPQGSPNPEITATEPVTSGNRRVAMTNSFSRRFMNVSSV